MCRFDSIRKSVKIKLNFRRSEWVGSLSSHYVSKSVTTRVVLVDDPFRTRVRCPTSPQKNFSSFFETTPQGVRFLKKRRSFCICEGETCRNEAHKGKCCHYHKEFFEGRVLYIFPDMLAAKVRHWVVAPACWRTWEASLSVVPVVMTSSTRQKCLPFTFTGERK